MTAAIDIEPRPILGINVIRLRDGREFWVEDIATAEQGRLVLAEVDASILAIEDQIDHVDLSTHNGRDWKKRAERALKVKRRQRPTIQARTGELSRAEKTAAKAAAMGREAEQVPDGSVSGLALRNAATRDELEYERIGGRLYTTLAAIREMRARCRRKPKVQGSGSSGGTSAPTESDGPAPGPSRTMETSASALASAQHALESRLKQLRTPLPGTSSSAVRPRVKSTVVPMPSRSRTSSPST